jgi:hypothetical protein
MAALLDKRNAVRYGCDGEIIWSYFQKDRSKNPEGIRWNALGEIKWCRKLTGGKKGLYGIGFKYHPN